MKKREGIDCIVCGAPIRRSAKLTCTVHCSQVYKRCLVNVHSLYRFNIQGHINNLVTKIEDLDRKFMQVLNDDKPVIKKIN
jgi:hypothetical protein